MMLLSEPEGISPTKHYFSYGMVIIIVIASATYFLVLRPVADSEPKRSSAPTRLELPAPITVPVKPEPTPIEPKIIETPLPILESAPAVVLDPVSTPPPIVLQVMADIDGADVFIDRQYVGTTPFESAALSPGRYRVNVSASGYVTHAEDIQVNKQLTSMMVSFKEIRLDERAAVIHKHRFGDCTGELVATMSGIRYQTSDDDAFEIALDALEEFAVDYLEHNLRIKLRNGKTYNFTDENNNADTLLVFHKEVEEARNRLALTDKALSP